MSGAAVFTLSQMMATGAENAAVKSALEAAELDLRTAAPDLAADLTRRVAELLYRAHAAGVVREDLTVEELMALVAGAFAAIGYRAPPALVTSGPVTAGSRACSGVLGIAFATAPKGADVDVTTVARCSNRSSIAAAISTRFAEFGS